MIESAAPRSSSQTDDACFGNEATTESPPRRVREQLTIQTQELPRSNKRECKAECKGEELPRLDTLASIRSLDDEPLDDAATLSSSSVDESRFGSGQGGEFKKRMIELFDRDTARINRIPRQRPIKIVDQSRTEPETCCIDISPNSDAGIGAAVERFVDDYLAHPEPPVLTPGPVDSSPILLVLQRKRKSTFQRLLSRCRKVLAFLKRALRVS